MPKQQASQAAQLPCESNVANYRYKELSEANLNKIINLDKTQLFACINNGTL